MKNMGTLIDNYINRIINGNFVMNQRAYVTATALAANAYAHDRWKAGAAGCTYSFTQGIVDTFITITSGSLMQVVEDRNIEGGNYSLSWAGTATGRIAVNGATPSGVYSTSPLRVSGATIGQTITVEFTSGTLGQVQIETGSGLTGFERLPYANIELMCQRYYQVYALVIIGGQANVAAAKFYSNLVFSKPMRITPTVAFSNSVVTNAGAMTLLVAQPTHLQLTMSATATGASNATATIRLNADY